MSNYYTENEISGNDYARDLLALSCDDELNPTEAEKAELLDLLTDDQYLYAKGFDMANGDHEMIIEEAIEYIENL